MRTPGIAGRLALFVLALTLALEATTATAAVSAPLLKWSRGGCYNSWCETAWYSSPALADVNGDGIRDVVASAYTVFALNGLDGKLLWRAGSNGQRTWPGVVVANLDLTGRKEIVVAQGGGYLSVYDLAGNLKWQRQPTTGELRGLLAADLDGDQSTLEIAVAAARSSAVNTWVYDSAGQLRTGWPQLKGDKGYAWGVYNANLAAGNLAPGDTALELVVPSDVHYINIYKPSGAGLRVNVNAFPGRTWWGQVGIWENAAVERRGWGTCDGTPAESLRANFAHGPAVIADLNGDGVRELVAVGNTHDCSASDSHRYSAPYLLNKDRTRFNKDGFDWRTIPRNTGAPLVEDYNVIESVHANPVVADLDGDGRREILFPSYDGRLHAFWLDKTERGHWPYSVYQASEAIYRFASEPVVADLDRDGKAEVIFTSWTQKGSGQTGRLHILGWDGQPMHEIDLPTGGGDWNGGLAAPTLGNVDTDKDLEVVVNTALSGVVVYDLPGTAGAKVQWATGRGNFQRTGSR